MKSAALVLDPGEARHPETALKAPRPARIYAAGEPVQVRVSLGAARWLDIRSASTGRSRSELVRRALDRLGKYADAYAARRELLARRPWALHQRQSRRVSFRLSPAERALAESLSERFARKAEVGAAVRLAVYIAAMEEVARRAV